MAGCVSDRAEAGATAAWFSAPFRRKVRPVVAVRQAFVWSVLVVRPTCRAARMLKPCDRLAAMTHTTVMV